MGNSLVKNNLHVVFHVKSRGVTIERDHLPRLFEYIGGIVNSLGGVTFIVGGVQDHVHVLFSLPATMALADFVRTIKAKSSRWLKTVSAGYASFSWQEGYGAFSVSPTLIDKTVNYIRRQEEHHRKRSFQEEVMLFVEAYNIENTDGCQMLQ